MKDTATLLREDIKDLIQRARGIRRACDEPGALAMCLTHLEGAARTLLPLVQSEENESTIAHMTQVLSRRDCPHCETNGGECELHPRDPTDDPDERDTDMRLAW
jgi:hypothetical protein